MSPAERLLLVFTTVPDPDTAASLARHLVAERLAACVSIHAPCASTYRWQGAVAQAIEIPLIIKTTAHRYDALEAALRARHPYELPEIVAVPAERVLPGYLAWVTEETRHESPEPC